jgi:putative copper resistance protein D
MTLNTAEVTSRFLHYTAVTIHFGALSFFFRELPVEHCAEASRLRTVRNWLIAMVLLAIASGLAWFAFTTARISESLSAAVNPEALSVVLRETDFGPLWAIRMLLAILMLSGLISSTILATRWVQALYVGLSAALLASLALIGHARSEEGVIGAVHVIADAVHLLAAGLWLGGLFGLLLLLTAPRSTSQQEAATEALRDFAGRGSFAVAMLIATGIVNTALLVGSPEALVSTSYGRLLLCKIALFIAMLGFAAANRFKILPRLHRGEPDRSRTLALVKRSVLIEQLADLSVLMIVSALGTWAPPTS